jgi:hypothetical protein
MAGGGPEGDPSNFGLGVGRLGQLQSCGEVREGGCVLVGQGEEATRELVTALERPRQEILVIRELGSSHRERRYHPHETRTERGRDGGRAAATGDGLG